MSFCVHVWKCVISVQNLLNDRTKEDVCKVSLVVKNGGIYTLYMNERVGSRTRCILFFIQL